MSELDDQYRSALRWYPAVWRSSNGEALLGTLLDVADAEGRSVPTSLELRDLRVNGLRQRGLDVVPAEVRSRASSFALGLGTALALVLLVGLEWAPWISLGDRDTYGASVGFGPFESAGAVVDLLWIAAFVAGMLRLRVAIDTALLLSIAASVVVLLLPAGPATIARPSATSLAILAFLALVVLLGRGASNVRRAGSTAIALGVSLVAITAFQWRTFPAPGLFAFREFWGTFPLLWVGLFIAVLILVCGILRRWAWLGALYLTLTPVWIGLVSLSAWYRPEDRIVPVLLIAAFLAAFPATTVARQLAERLQRKASDGLSS